MLPTSALPVALVGSALPDLRRRLSREDLVDGSASVENKPHAGVSDPIVTYRTGMRPVVRVILAMIVAATPAAASSQIHLTAGLPDLGMLPPSNFSIETEPDGDRLLRFDSVLVNAGSGAFELYGKDPTSDGTLAVTQRVQDDAGSWTERSTDARMVFAGDGHDHWHVRELQMFTIAIADAPLVTLGRDVKIGFCFSDNHEWISDSAAAYTDRMCEMRPDGYVPMGLSVGWGDVYESSMAFQYLDITDLAENEYIILLRADPADDFLEVNEQNNAAWARISISHDEVTVLSSATEIVEP